MSIPLLLTHWDMDEIKKVQCFLFFEAERSGSHLCLSFRASSRVCLDVSQGWSLLRIAHSCVYSGATSTCPSTASSPPSPSWACSWQGRSCSSTSRTAITGQRMARRERRMNEAEVKAPGMCAVMHSHRFLKYSDLFQANQDVQSIYEQPNHPGGHAVLCLHLPLWSGWRFRL